VFPFRYAKAVDEQSALRAGAAGARYIAGDTTLVDLMRESVERPDLLVDFNSLPYTSIDPRGKSTSDPSCGCPISPLIRSSATSSDDQSSRVSAKHGQARDTSLLHPQPLRQILKRDQYNRIIATH
jgi:hypothetical protein